MTKEVYDKGVKSDFINALHNTPKNPLKDMMLMTKSRGANETYITLGSLSGVKRLLDEVKFSKMSSYKYEIPNVDFYGSVQEDRNTIEDAKEYTGGAITNEIAKIGRQFENLPAKEVTALMEDATGLAFDGVTFWSSTRTISGSGVLNNVVDTTGALNTLTLADAAFGTAKARLLGFKDVNGDPFNDNAELALICPAHTANAWEKLLIDNAQLIASGGATVSNIFNGVAKVIVNTYASSSMNTAYLVNTANKDAFVWQERSAPKGYMEDDNKKPEIGWYWKARYGVGYGVPTSIVKITT